MAQLLLDQSKIPVACLQKEAGIGMPQTVNRVRRKQTGPLGTSLENLLYRSGCHMSSGVTRYYQGRFGFNRLSVVLLPVEISLAVLSKWPGKEHQPLLAPLAFADQDGAYLLVQAHISAFQGSDFHYPQSRRQA